MKEFLLLLSYSVNSVVCAETKSVYDMKLLAFFCIALHKYYIRQHVIYEMMSHSVYTDCLGMIYMRTLTSFVFLVAKRFKGYMLTSLKSSFRTVHLSSFKSACYRTLINLICINDYFSFIHSIFLTQDTKVNVVCMSYRNFKPNIIFLITSKYHY